MIFKKTEHQLTQHEITEWLNDLRGKPFNTASNFDVTSVFRVESNGCGTYYFAGVNTENSHLRLSIHAEEGCLSAMSTAFGKTAKIAEVWVMGAPRHLTPEDESPLANIEVTCCGKCRQQIVGFADVGTIVHSISLKGAHSQMMVGDEFLPKAFSFNDFSPDTLKPSYLVGAPFTEANTLRRIIRDDYQSKQNILDWLLTLESVDHASGVGHAVVLELTNGHYVAGVTVEEAAYVSIDPISCAIANARTFFGDFSVKEVWSYSEKDKIQASASIPSSSSSSEPIMTPLYSMSQSSSYSSDTALTPLALSSLQVLAQFAENNEVKIKLMNSNGGTSVYQPLLALDGMIPRLGQPVEVKSKKRMEFSV